GAHRADGAAAELAFNAHQRKRECRVDAFGARCIVDRSGEVRGNVVLVRVANDRLQPLHLEPCEGELALACLQRALQSPELTAELRVRDGAVGACRNCGAGNERDRTNRDHLRRDAYRLPGAAAEALRRRDGTMLPLVKRGSAPVVAAIILPAPEATGHHAVSPLFCVDQSPLLPPLFPVTCTSSMRIVRSTAFNMS